MPAGPPRLGGGHVDILVNNAGVFPFGPTPDATDADIDTVYAVNVKAPFILVAELAPAMAARGKGAIVNVLTMVAHFGVAGMALYGSSKAALTLLTKAWAAEFGPQRRAGQRGQPRPHPHRGHRADGRASWTSSPPWPLPDARPPPKRSPPPSATSPATTPASSTARSSTSTAAATRHEWGTAHTRADRPRAQPQNYRGRLNGAPNGFRTRAAALKGRCPRPLDDGGLPKKIPVSGKFSIRRASQFSH